MSARLLLLFLVLLMMTGQAPATRAWQRQRAPRLPDYLPDANHPHRPEFTFTRLIYSSGGWYDSWTTDYPKADEQFIAGLRGWAGSLLSIATDPAAVGMDDPKLFTYPMIYAVEPGRMFLSDEDAAHLREYLERGGLLMLDDFWGEREWWNVQQQMRRVFPNREIQELPLDHPLFHCYFDVDEVVQVPNVDNWIYRHRTDEKGGIVPHYEAILDDDGRVLVFIARNTDNGDAWEWIDDPRYPLKYGLAAYKIGMNVIVYAMSH
ncbi:MAG: DUF4159 domain-containing protein [Blastocatellia bacterium]